MPDTSPSEEEMIEAVRSAMSLREHWLAMNEPGSTIWLENKARLNALRAALQRLEASRWRDIESAPKDGTYILLRFAPPFLDRDSPGVSVGCWTASEKWWLTSIWAASQAHNEPVAWASLLPSPPSTTSEDTKDAEHT